MPSVIRRGSWVAAVCVATALVLSAQDWKTSDKLSGVDFSGLSAAQKTTALKILRERGCSCGCNMKIAECRVVDPSCSYSSGLAAAVIDALKQGKTEAQAIAAADASNWAHVQPQKILDNAVSIPIAGAPVLGPQNAPVTDHRIFRFSVSVLRSGGAGNYFSPEGISSSGPLYF